MMKTDFTHDPETQSWVESANGHPEFPVQNLPLGVFTPQGAADPRGGVAIGDVIVDLAAVAPHFSAEGRKAAETAGASSLNNLVAMGNGALRTLRQDLFRLLTDPAHEAAVRPALHEAATSRLFAPFDIRDYTDFYTGINHAVNVGKLFRPDNPLLPNYKYVPIGYHGRASSVRLSGEEVARPVGQTKAPHADAPGFGPCKRLDYELEMAVWVGSGNDLGKPIPIGEAEQHIAGLSILNDWSARDIQAWEYQPLGPFLSKNFHSTISPWIVTLDALAPYRTAQPPRPAGDPEPLPYLSDAADQQNGAFNVSMDVFIHTARMRAEGSAPVRLSKGSMTAMYWTVAQLVAHHSCNGCNLAPGDLLGTGTLSGVERDSYGSLLELTEGGKRPVELGGGETRTFLEDGDEIVMKASAQAPGYACIGFGECRGRIKQS